MARTSLLTCCAGMGLTSAVAALLWVSGTDVTAQRPAGEETTRPSTVKVLTAADCTAEKLGRDIAASAIAEPVRSVTLSPPSWVEAAGGPAHCRINGSMAPLDAAATAKPINFSVVLPGSWNGRAAHMGGGGMNGLVPNLTGRGPGGGEPSLL